MILKENCAKILPWKFGVFTDLPIAERKEVEHARKAGVSALFAPCYLAIFLYYFDTKTQKSSKTPSLSGSVEVLIEQIFCQTKGKFAVI